MNIWYKKLQEDLKQSKYNFKKSGLYIGEIQHRMESLLKLLKEEENSFEVLDEL